MSTTYGNLTYRITQVSLVVRDLDEAVAAYHEAFGWGAMEGLRSRIPVHHDTQIDGKPAEFSLRGAEVIVGDMNFELLQPLSGPSKWQEFLDTYGEGIMSIAVMFDTAEESEKCKKSFAEHGIGVTMSARIGDHIEYYYLDTQPRFKCPIESGSGHALDYMKPAHVYPPAKAGPAAAG